MSEGASGLCLGAPQGIPLASQSVNLNDCVKVRNCAHFTDRKKGTKNSYAVCPRLQGRSLSEPGAKAKTMI